MRLLYVFPHPDDESFGPALAISKQRREGHEVRLLTLTRGGATKRRHELGLSVEGMGEVRHREMLDVARVLDLADLTVLDLPDGGLAQMDPIEIEGVVREHVLLARPDALVTYAVHGISGFPDHLVTHAVVKRVFCELRREGSGPRRLALFTLLPSAEPDGPFQLRVSKEEDVDAAVEVGPEDVARAQAALACYATYRQTIAEADPLRRVGGTVYFELFGERHDPRLGSLTEGL